MPSTPANPSPPAAWWLDRSDILEGFADGPPSDTRSGCYRFGDGYLEIESNCSSVLEVLASVYADCSVARVPGAEVRLSCSVFSISYPPLAVVSFRDGQPPNMVERALTLLQYQHLGSETKYLEVSSAVPGWRLIARADTPEQPMLAASPTHVIVDRSGEPWRFIVNYLVSTVMGLQKDVLFVHAGSAAVHGRGVLLAGPSKAGKTTLSLALASRGHRFFGENIAAMRKNSKELLPFRRTGYVRPGPRARAVEDSLKSRPREPELVDLGASGTEARIAVRVAELFPDAGCGPARLGAAYFLRGFRERASVEAFRPSLAEVEKILKPLSYDYTVAASWGPTPASWLLKYLAIIELLSTIPCYFLNVGPTDETATLIERITEGSWVSR